MTVTQIFGPPGCGKTTALMDILEDALRQGTHPSRISVCSFSRKAINEFVDRAVTRFDMDRKQFMHMRTLHSTAFRALGLRKGDVLTSEDYRRVGAMVGESFDDVREANEGTLLPWGYDNGAKYLAIISRARYRMVSIDEEWASHQTFNMSKAKCRQIAAQIEEYKSKLGKLDFIDMIQHYIDRAEVPHFDLFILDEAQDLTPLQWLMAKKISANSERTFTAGDDDQAIHEWNGADAKSFIDFGDERRILSQSYRLPRSVFDVSDRIVRRIVNRVRKDYRPLDREGRVVWHNRISDVPLDSGSITIMARTNGIAKTLASYVHEQGYYYSLHGKPVLSPEKITTIKGWRALADGDEIDLPTVKSLYENLPKQGPRAVIKRGSIKLLEAAMPGETFTSESLQKHYGMKVSPEDSDVFEVMGLGDHLTTYLRRIEKMGEDLTKDPRIKISTIHAMKGGEDDICVLYTGTTKFIEQTASAESEHRVFYVGVTRAKKTLHIVEPPLYEGPRRNYLYSI
jgi:superfamily I DNA/RNA helicase